MMSKFFLLTNSFRQKHPNGDNSFRWHKNFSNASLAAIN
ncbi:hypothetical protein MNBD_ALPHA11-1129 [hydrothermal vent metagenome]|uniref:Uncharacterized protein n=1 Tax=hydrothermal vent metagenome TaxID=652676 RepID=A0A3B0U6Q0_9ZZZZ